MTDTYTKAKFWKCALQVNSLRYIAYRGTDHELTESEYNLQLVKICKEQQIKIIGIADHGNVSGIEAIKAICSKHDIVVFPGFEIASSEKIHFVCLFPEDTAIPQLHSYLGDLGKLDETDGISPSRYSAQQILEKVENLGGCVIAAHCTDDSGVLKKRMNHIWKSPLLRVVQIPDTIESLKTVEDGFYYHVLQSRNPDYKRDNPMAIINAKDVEQPQTLNDPKASCLVKMTAPTFSAFKLALKDPKSRIRLNSDITVKHYSQLLSLSITGGYLDEVKINFSEHLNAVIGGRGTGKSTLLESIRYALELDPIGKSAKLQHQKIIKENLGKASAHIELRIRSSKMHGKVFTISRKYPESSYVKDEHGKISSFTPKDLLPDIEIYGQNEIYEIAQNSESQKKLLLRFLQSGYIDSDKKISDLLSALAQNRKKLMNASEKLMITEESIARSPKLEEQVLQYTSLGIEEHLAEVPLLEKEKQLKERILQEEVSSLVSSVTYVQDSLPDTAFLSEKSIRPLPHYETLTNLRDHLKQIHKESDIFIKDFQTRLSPKVLAIQSLIAELENAISQDEISLEQMFSKLPASEGKSGREIGLEFQSLLQEIERIKPQKTFAAQQKQLVNELQKNRKAMLAELSELRASRSALFARSIKPLKRKLEGKLKLSVLPESDRQPLIDHLLSCNMENIGERRLLWIHEHDDISPTSLAERIMKGRDDLMSAGWGITNHIADALMRLPNSKILEMEEIELHDRVLIELNVAHEGRENYRSMDKLSTGQQCTAILHLLLLQSKDPLIMDQPEDNLDNAFIAERIVAELRSEKLNRQFLFATHNANIPVFGDAEWIGILESSEGHGTMPVSHQGSIDVEDISEKTANILEGGKTAFYQRKEKYGY